MSCFDCANKNDCYDYNKEFNTPCVCQTCKNPHCPVTGLFRWGTRCIHSVKSQFVK